MTDKEIIRSEIEEYKRHVLVCGYHGQGEYEDGNKQGKLDACDKFLSFIDSMQRNLTHSEVTKIIDQDDPLEKEIEKYLEGFIETPTKSYFRDTIRYFYKLGKENNDPVSDELEEEALVYSASDTITEDGKLVIDSEKVNAFKAGAEWQKEQFEKNRLKHCNSITNEQAELEQGFIDQHLNKYQRMPTFLDAIEYGMRLQQEQMMKDATAVTVHIDAGNYPYIPQMELYDYDKDVPLAKAGDKYKVVLIKEE